MTDDVHQHRRHNDADDISGQRLNVAVDSTFSKFLARWAVPMLLVLLGWFLVDKTSQITSKQDEQGLDIVQIKSDVRDTNTRMDSYVIRQIQSNTLRGEDHEKRIQQLERSVRTP